MEKTKVTIYTDGACSGNPGPGGYAAIIMLGENKKEIYGACENTTNNRMELMAAIEGLKVLKKACEVILYSDSAYLVNAYNNKWIYGWKKNGWRNSNKEPVKNIDLWEQLEELRQVHTVTFMKVKGHADNKYNNRCDELAVEAIQKLQKGELPQHKEQIEHHETDMQKVFGTLPTFETERLRIRLFTKQDVDDLYEYCSDTEVTKYVSFDKYTNREQAIGRIEDCLDAYNKLDHPIPWAIEYKEDGKLIGGIDFIKWSTDNKTAEVGYILNKNYWNKGIMTEALRSILNFGFEKMDVNRIEILCDERNIASAKVIEKNGLKYEGTLRQKQFVKGEFISLKCYSILREEYINL